MCFFIDLSPIVLPTVNIGNYSFYMTRILINCNLFLLFFIITRNNKKEVKK
jgi:hypothetical protein